MNIINVLKIAFITLLPYHVLFSISVLLLQLLHYMSPHLSFIDIDSLTKIVILFGGIYAILINQSIAYFLSSMYYENLNKIIGITLNLVIFISIEALDNQVNNNAVQFPKQTIIAIITPIISLYVMSEMLKLMDKYGTNLSLSLSQSLSSSFKSIVPYIVTFFSVTTAIHLVNQYLTLNFDTSYLDSFSNQVLLLLKTLFSHLVWFFGIHGSNFIETLFPTNFHNNLLLQNFTVKEFYDIFVIIGGSGSCMSLLLAIFLFSKDKHVTRVGKIALPFLIFNISEILIFGIPIFLNISLLIPFILTPVINFAISYLVVVNFGLFEFNDINLPWVTPIFINIYLVTDGNLFAVLYQFALLFVGAMIYKPFIQHYTSIQSSQQLQARMTSKLDLPIDTDYRQEIKFHEAQSQLVQSHHKVDKIVDLLNSERLEIHYQPKVHVSSLQCLSFEALLRIKDKEGNNIPPSFIIEIEDSGLASLLDLWVCRRVKQDLDAWHSMGFEPTISVNIFPHTLLERNYVQEIATTLHGYDICFEILERRACLSELTKQNLQYLRDRNFAISLDDLGTGYTNFEVLYELPLTSVKIDRSIINITDESRGLEMYKNICELCHDLGYKIILEGVETQSQVDRLVDDKTYAVQGWYYSKAVPFADIIPLVQQIKNRLHSEGTNPLPVHS